MNIGICLFIIFIAGAQTIAGSDLNHKTSSFETSLANELRKVEDDREAVRMHYVEQTSAPCYFDLRPRLNAVTPNEFLPIFNARRTRKQRCFDCIDCICFDKSDQEALVCRQHAQQFVPFISYPVLLSCMKQRLMLGAYTDVASWRIPIGAIISMTELSALYVFMIANIKIHKAHLSRFCAK